MPLSVTSCHATRGAPRTHEGQQVALDGEPVIDDLSVREAHDEIAGGGELPIALAIGRMRSPIGVMLGAVALDHEAVADEEVDAEPSDPHLRADPDPSRSEPQPHHALEAGLGCVDADEQRADPRRRGGAPALELVERRHASMEERVGHDDDVLVRAAPQQPPECRLDVVDRARHRRRGTEQAAAVGSSVAATSPPHVSAAQLRGDPRATETQRAAAGDASTRRHRADRLLVGVDAREPPRADAHEPTAAQRGAAVVAAPARAGELAHAQHSEPMDEGIAHGVRVLRRGDADAGPRA